MDAKGNFTYYNYDRSTENVTVARNRQGTEYNYSYDSYGNVTGVQAQGNPNASDPLKGDDYYIRNKRSGLYIDISNNSTTYGTPVIQYDAHRASNQRFYILGAPMDDQGYFAFIKARHADSIGFAPKDSSSDDGAKIVTQSDSGVPASQWYLQYNEDDGSYSFKNKATGKYLDLESDSNERLVNLVQKEKDSNAPSQRWFLELANPTGDKTTSSATYTENGAFLDTVTNNRGYVAQYDYNQHTGVLDSLILNRGTNNERETSYTYDSNNNLMLSQTQTSGEKTATVGYTYDQNRLTEVTSNGFSYRFNYDTWGNMNDIKVGNQSLTQNIFASGNGKLLESRFGNGDRISYGYDKQERQTQKLYNGILSFEWTYNNRGQIAKHKDYVNHVDYDYSYDSLGRLLGSKGSNGFRVNYDYDIYSRIINSDFLIDGIQSGSRSHYNLQDQTTEHCSLYDGVEQNALYYDFDSIGRPVKVRLYDYTKDGYLNEVSCEYLTPEEGKTSTLISKYKVGSTSYTYDYDEYGNITKIYENGTEKVSYTYDGFNQLIRENNRYLNKTITYDYDVGGNLISKSEYTYTTETPSSLNAQQNYDYQDLNWKDKLTSFNGQSITYDEIGNPLTYRDGWNFTWKNGRQLATTKKTGYTISYEYDADGLRTQKTVNGVTTDYYYEGNKLLREKTATKDIYYYYDNSGKVMGIRYNGANYYPLRNLQGDVVSLTDHNGNKVVNYVYDNWGKVISVTGSMAATLGKDNPIRYRGYYYDEETKFYYLRSRYYDPETCRFLNMDGAIGANAETINGDYNVFSYCKNDPVNLSDESGMRYSPFDDLYDNCAPHDPNMFYLTSDDRKHWKPGSNRPDNTPQNWWDGVPNPAWTIPSSNDWISAGGNYILGSSISLSTEISSNVKVRSNHFLDSNNIQRQVPGYGVYVRKFPKASKVLGIAGGVVTGVTGGLDIANTWTAQNNNTYEKRLIKTGVQVAGIGVMGATGYVAGYAITTCFTVGLATSATPVGWALLAAGLIFVTPLIRFIISME